MTGNSCIVMEKRIWYNFNGLSKLDTKIKTPKDVEKYWDLPLIGVIPMDDKKVKGAHRAKNGGRR